MSAEHLGRCLLQKVEEESLAELLADIRAADSELQKSRTGICALDQIFDIFCGPQQSAQRPTWESAQVSSDEEERYYDNHTTPSRPGVADTKNSARPKPNVIHLTSAHSAAGKTNLLYYLCALSVLSKSYNGREGAVVWLDTDSRFSALRLAQIVRHVLSSSVGNTDNDQVIREALKHVHVFRPQSSAQLIGTLKALPNYLTSRDEHYSQQRTLGLVILDSATAFYWADRAAAEVARLSDPGADTPPSAVSQVHSELREMAKTFGSFICFTTDASRQQKFRPKASDSTRTVADSPLPLQNSEVYQDVWSTFATLTLDVHRVPVPRFASAMTIEECAKDQPRRIDAVNRGHHRAQIMWTGNESNKFREDIRSLQTGDGFSFNIVGHGLEIE